MTFHSFLLGLVPLCMKIINSVVVVGLYYGFLTTFSIGPSYLFLLRAQVMEEGSEKKVAATTGFISGQLLMFLSIYFPPLYIALGRPNTITVLALSYFWLNCWSKKDFFDYESTALNSMRNFRIQWLFVNNLIFQLLNHFFFPSSMLARLVNIYMFRCNNKMLFVTSSFVGWLIGWVIVHNFFRKWLELGLVWIRHRSKKYIRSNKYFVEKLRYSMDRIFSILFFLSCAYALSRIPFPMQILKTKNGQTETTIEEKVEDPNKIDETKEIEDNINENDDNSTIFQKKITKKDPFFFEKNISTLLFDSNQWDRPLRYINIKNDNSKNKKALRDEMSQYFFDICESDGKERICFTFPPSVSIFLETLKKSIIPPAPEKSGFHCSHCKNPIEEINDYELPLSFSDEWYTFKNTPVWVSANKEKKKKEKREFLNRIKSLEKKSSFLNRLETRTRMCNDNSRKKYLPKRYDPFLSGSCRKTIEKNSILKKASTKNFIEFQINRIHRILVPYTDNEQLELKMKIKRFDDKNSEAIESTNFFTVIKKAISRSLIIFPYLSYAFYAHAYYFFWKLLLDNLNDARGFFFSHPAGTPFVERLRFLKIHFSFFFRNHREFFEYYWYIVNFKRGRALYTHRSPSRFNFTSCTSSGFSLFFFPGKNFWKQKKDPINYENLEREKEKIYENFFLKKLLLFLTHANSQNIRTSQNKINEISKLIPRWEYQLITHENDRKTEDDNLEIRSREAKRVVIFTDIKETKKNEDDSEDLTTIRYLEQPDFDRDLINGSVRAQRRKVVIWKVFQGNAHSPLFVYRIKNPILFSLTSLTSNIFESMKSVFRTIVESTNEQKKIEENGIEKEKKNRRDEGRQMKIAARWETHNYGQGIRSCLLLIHSFFRKYILFPSLIIAKNLGRIFLHQRPEWSEDFQELNKEMHIICTYNGTSLSDDLEFPENWWVEGLQIKIIFPFRLKPWHNHQSYAIETVKEAVSFLTVFGLEAKEPFGSPQKGPSFWKPVFKELGKKVAKMKKNYFKFKEKKKKKIISKETPIQLRELREVEIYESNKIQEEKDSIISNQIINQSFSQTGSPGLTNSSLTEKKIKDLTERIGTIRNQIQKNINKKKKNHMGPKKSGSNVKSSEKWKILIKRRTIRLISKFPLYWKFLIELIYRHIFLSIELIYRHIFLSSIELKLAEVCKYSSYINTRLRLTKKIIDKSLNLIKKKPIPFKKSLDNIRHIKSNLHIFFDLSCVSQAYVFYKLAQIQVSNLHKLRSVLQYQGISLFLKSEIKDSLEKEGMVHSKLQLDDQKLTNCDQNQWKNWLRGYYPYDLSSIGWSRLMSEKWRNTSRQPYIDKKEKLRKCNSYKTDQVSNSKKKWEVYKLANQKENFQKYYRYDLLADKFLNSQKCKEIIYGLTFQGNKNRELSCNTHGDRLYDILKTTPIYNYVDMLAVEKMVDRKYLRLKSLYRRQKMDIESSITTDPNTKKNMQRKTHNYLKISISNAYLNISYFRLPDNLLKFHNVFVDWMGMNEKMLNYSISNLEGWFFPEFVLFHQAYKMKPWFRPNKLLLLNLINLNSNEKKKKKQVNQEEPPKEKDSGSVMSQQKSIEEKQKSIEEKQKSIEEKQKSSEEKQKSSEKNPVNMKKKKSQLDSFLERYLLFQCKWQDNTSDERLLNNQEIYCLLLRLIDPRKIILSSIQTKEMDLDIMMIHHSLTCAELFNKGILIIEPTRLFGKNDGLFLMYQTISTSLIDKSKYQTNQKYQEERYVSKNHFYFLIPENILSFRRRRKFRILISFNSKYRKDENRNLVFWNGKNSNQALPENKGLNLNIEENPFMKLKLFLWPNYRLEDLACMNRYWFNTNNGSRFSMLRIHLYPQLKIRG